MARVAKTAYAECKGKLYVKAKYAGMHPFCLVVDGVPMAFFGKEKTPYLTIDDAIRWHRNEIKATKGLWRTDFLNAFLEAKKNFIALKRD